MNDLILHLLLFIAVLSCFFVKYQRNRLNFVVTSIVAAVVATSFTIGALSVAATAAVLGVVGGLIVYGGMALSMAAAKKAGGVNASATYANPVLQTQTNPDLPVPLLYGTVKVAGNRIWQNDSSEKYIKRIVAFAEGVVEDFTDIRLNDIEYSKVKNCTVQKFYGHNVQSLPGYSDGSSMVTLDKVGSLRNLAYLAVTCPKSDKVDINYNLTCVVKGKKVRVYTTTTNWTLKYSENPAWILLDFLTSYNGLGLALDNRCIVSSTAIDEIFDMESFLESAAYCDELVSYVDAQGNTKTSKRFTFNMIFDSQTSARDLIDEIYRCCRGGLFTHNGKLQFKIDKAEPVSQVFTENDIVKGSETFQVIPAEEHYEILRVSYISPEHEWQKVEAFAEIPVYRYGAPIEHSVNIYSCTNFQQASRLAWYYVNSKALCPYFGSFQTDYRAYTLEVGDVIQINSLLMGLTNYKVKVTSVNDDGSGVFTVNWRNYDERLYNDTLGCQEPRVLVSTLSDIYTVPDDVQGFNVTQANNTLNFVWEFNQDSSATYEIRWGENWETGQVLGKNLTDNKFSWVIPKSDTLYKFYIKAFNNYNYSENATQDVYYVNDIPNVNEILSFNLFDNLNGTYTNTHLYKRPFRAVKLDSAETWQTLDEPWTNTDKYYENNNKWAGKTVPLGYYTSQVYDVGGNLTSYVNYDLTYDSENENQSITPEWRYSEDGVTWSDWQLSNVGEYTFRYCQFRAVFNADFGAQMWLKSYNVTIDVPDKEIEMVVDVPINGSLEISYDFISVPSIIGTINDDYKTYMTVASKTNKNAVISVYNGSGGVHEGIIENLDDIIDWDSSSWGDPMARVNLRLKGY